MKKISLALVAVLCVLSACKEKKVAHDPSKPNKADALMGQWNGPEGTYLKFGKIAGAYGVEIKNLDGLLAFPATTDEDGHIMFERDGVKETITMGTGEDTGMKWLTDKYDCVIIKPGEGYCRD